MMKLSVIVPVLNEKATLAEVLDRILKVDIPVSKEIIVIDDGSTDGSTQILRSYVQANSAIIKAVYRKKPGGKGNAIQEAAPHITGDIVIIQDADLEYDIEDYGRLIAPIINNEAEVVFGSRFLGSIERMKPQHLLANRILTFLANFIYGLKITDEATGYKVVKADVFRRFRMQAKKFEFCPEVVAKSARLKCRIVEVPVKYRARTVKEGKKIKWHDAFEAVWALVKYRFWKG